MKKHTKKTINLPSADEIAARAFQLYENEGRPEGHATEHWLTAETQLAAEHNGSGAQARTNRVSVSR